MTTKTSHFTIAFSVDHSHDSHEGVTADQFLQSLMARVIDIHRNHEWKEAAAHDETEDNIPVPGLDESQRPTGEDFVVIQQGGSSSERYVTSHENEQVAHDFRVDCTKNGSYPTSPVIRVPAVLALFPGELYELLDKVATAELDYVEVDEDDETEDEDEEGEDV
jgi:hypothetical protein